MKGLREKKGFTLIELLAVIVVLAIVMVLATTTVLPYMTKATKNSFAIEANAAVDAASQAMSLISIGSISGTELVASSDYTKSEATANGVTTTTYCFTVKKLVDLGLWQKDSSEVTGTTPTYGGTVTVTAKSDSKAYTYSVDMHNKDLYVDGVTGTVDGETDVQDLTDTAKAGLKLSCQ
ncbi:MAG: type II secretion system protein [Bacilli bacterium]|nr:type II secretion system protein [Bacilli bacterium]